MTKWTEIFTEWWQNFMHHFLKKSEIFQFSISDSQKSPYVFFDNKKWKKVCILSKIDALTMVWSEKINNRLFFVLVIDFFPKHPFREWQICEF